MTRKLKQGWQHRRLWTRTSLWAVTEEGQREVREGPGKEARRWSRVGGERCSGAREDVIAMQETRKAARRKAKTMGDLHVVVGREA
ncbi:hypothetical protein E2C01_090331 [Portunus trituberculatus]|uniref:Uncharacterized protein n=1 Tax=Portunus trituberculatus TaxID=210409 RepID=A0A5B7JKL3_PORTR|nr:hypothetical protein [Portunus trituberculatus]